MADAVLDKKETLSDVEKNLTQEFVRYNESNGFGKYDFEFSKTTPFIYLALFAGVLILIFIFVYNLFKVPSSDHATLYGLVFVIVISSIEIYFSILKHVSTRRKIKRFLLTKKMKAVREAWYITVFQITKEGKEQISDSFVQKHMENFTTAFGHDGQKSGQELSQHPLYKELLMKAKRARAVQEKERRLKQVDEGLAAAETALFELLRVTHGNEKNTLQGYASTIYGTRARFKNSPTQEKKRKQGNRNQKHRIHHLACVRFLYTHTQVN